MRHWTSPVAGVFVLVVLIASTYAQESAKPGPPPPARSPRETAATQLITGGKQEAALEELDRAAGEYRRAGDQTGVARVSLTRATVFRSLGKADEAARHAEQARRLSGEDPSLAVSALTLLSSIASERGELAAADRYLQAAAPIAERSPDVATRLRLLQARVRVADARGQTRESLDHAMRLVEVADRQGTVAQRVESRNYASTALLGLSRYDEALALAQEGYDLALQQDAPAVRASGGYQLAQANNHVWNLDRAAALWPAILDAYRAAGNERGLAIGLIQSINTWFALGEFERAAREGEDAVARLRHVGLAWLIAETSARVALSEVRRGRLEQAAEWSARARAEVTQTPAARHLFVHNDLGLVAIELRQFDQARNDFARVMQVARDIGNIEYEWRAGWGLGRTAIAEREPALAVPHLEKAIAVIERLRQTIPAASERAAFMTQRVGPYETLVEALIDSAAASGDESGRLALEVAERARSRALADLLAESRARLTDSRLLAVREEEAAFGRRFSDVQKRMMASAAPPEREEALKDLLKAEHEYESLVLRVRRESSAYAALAYPRPLSAAEISAMLAPDEAFVEFLITPKRGFVWVVRSDGVRCAPTLGQEALDPQIRLLQALLAANDQRAIERLGAHLYTQLLAPVASALGGAHRVIIVPDGALQRLPFALLRSDDRWLIEMHALTMAPSATILAHLRQLPRSPAPHALLAFAAPNVASSATRAGLDLKDSAARPLVLAAKEVQDARRLVGARPEDTLVGAAATEGVLKAVDARQYRILHFAAHAIVDEIVPRRSAVLLTASDQEDGLLQVNEIANLSLNADLVVLAACRSQIGRQVRGEGLLSLSRAFIHAGARSVMATLWDVADRETSWLMREFYERLSDGLAPDQALRAAQLAALSAGGPVASPANWAAFLMTGQAAAPILPPRQHHVRRWGFAGAGLAAAAIAVGLLVQRRRHPRHATSR